jgi:hypothetical protein
MSATMTRIPRRTESTDLTRAYRSFYVCQIMIAGKLIENIARYWQASGDNGMFNVQFEEDPNIYQYDGRTAALLIYA